MPWVSRKLTRESRDEALAQLDPISEAVLDWMPGESLYSLIARNHFYFGYGAHSQIIREFFGARDGVSLQPDMTEVEVLVARTKGILGSPRHILEERTLLRFYRIFMSRYEEPLLEPGQRNPDSMLKFPMALRKSQFKAKHPLKVCVRCKVQDVQQSGIPYWRLEHQFPGVWVCLEHDHGLQEIAVKPLASHKFFWQTPTESSFLPMSEALGETETFTLLSEMARFIVTISSDKEQGTRHVAESAECFRHYLAEAHLLLPSGRLKVAYKNKVALLCEHFVKFARKLRRHPGFSVLPDDQDLAYRLLSRFVSGRGMVLPLERLVITAWVEQMLEHL
nr:TniQ family protein [Massilia eburnea]